MSLNIIDNKSNVNNQEKELDYFTLNKKVYQELILINRPKTVLFQIMVHLACKVTYKNGLVGVHSEIFKTGLAKELGINDGHITRYFNQLQDMGFIKIFSKSPLVLQVLEVPQAPRLNDIKGLLLYVLTNPQQFNFHRNLKRKSAFFETFKEYNSQILVEKMKIAEVPKDHKSTEQEPDDYDPFGFK